MASALITLVASLTAGLFTQTSPPNLTTRLHDIAHITNFTTLLNLPIYSSLFKNISSKEGYQITVLAPTDGAFAKLPSSSLAEAFAKNDTQAIRDVLRYHVLQRAWSYEYMNGSAVSTCLDGTAVTGGQAVVAEQQPHGVGIFASALGEQSRIVSQNIPFQGGLLHTIDAFLIPPPALIPTAADHSNLTAFVDAINDASLNATIAGAKDVTIFAPSDGAFAKLKHTSTAEMAKLMKYHIVNTDKYVVGGSLHPFSVGYSKSMPNGTILQTLEGSNVSIHQSKNGTWTVNSATIVESDILLENGVVHVIDEVLEL